MDENKSYTFTPFQQWEIAFIYAFACTFNPQKDKVSSFYKLPDFTPQDLEEEVQKESSDLIHKIICASLGNTLNRKNPIESFKNSFQQLVTEKMKSFEIDLEVNPLIKENFNTLPVEMKLYLLHSLIEWQLQDSQAVRSIIDINNNNTARNQINPIKSYPLGMDSKKRTYWQFGESCWVWRTQSKSTLDWETVCRNRQDLESLVATLSPSSRYEKALIKVITEELYDLADKEVQKRVRKERAELRKLIPVEVSITKTQLRSRGERSKRVQYNYDDVYDGIDDDSDEYEEEDTEEKSKPPSPVRPAPTRWSSRLNKTPADEMSVDTTPNQSEMDTASPTPDVMETASSDVDMDTSRSQSMTDSRPISAMDL